jgi:hypothetical protein
MMSAVRVFAMTMFFMVIGFIATWAENDGDSIYSNAQIKEQVVFSGGYVNWAWGYTNFGWFIDRDGKVKSYTITDPKNWWGVNDPEHIKKPDMEHNYNQATKTLFEIPMPELLYKYSLIKNVANGPLSEPRDTGRDMGGKGYYCYQFDDSSRTYRQILLKVTGDISQENLNRDAITLTKWLIYIDEKSNLIMNKR